MATIPEEIVLLHILPLLSSKSLVRFRSVSKSWHSFIYHPSFFHLHRPTNRTHHFLFVSHDPQATLIATSQPHVFSAPFHHAVRTPSRATLRLTIPNLSFSETRVQCVNGLLCFHSPNRTWFAPCISAFTVIANPTTRQILTLPLDESIGNDREFFMSTFFGYDPVGDKFKVVRLFEFCDVYHSHQFKVFTLGADNSSWRTINPDISSYLKKDILYYHNRCVYFNGAIHWIFLNLTIVGFDVATERFREIRTFREEIVARDLQLPELVEIGGCLCLVVYKGSDLDLWILKDYEAREWEQKSIVLPSEIVEKKQVIVPFCGVPTGEILLLPYTLPRRVRGIYYDMEKMSFTVAVVMEMSQPLWPRGASEEVDIFFYEENLRFIE